MRVQRATKRQFVGAEKKHPKRLHWHGGPNTKLDGGEMVRLRRLRREGWSGSQLAAEFDCSVRTIWRMLARPTDDLIGPIGTAVILWARRNELWLSENEIASLTESIAGAVGIRLRNRVAKTRPRPLRRAA